MKRLLCYFTLAVSSLTLPLVEAGDLGEQQAYSLHDTLQLESISNLQGGIARGSRYNFNNSFDVEVNTAASGWWESGRWYTQVLAIGSNYPSELTGEYQTLSNIEADDNLLVYQFFYEHEINDVSKLLVGLHDFNSTFYALDSAHLFFNASFGIGPDASQVPPSIFPVTSTAVQLSFNWDENYLLAAVYDGIPGDPRHPRGTHVRWNADEGLFSVVEFGKSETDSYKWGLGCWQHTAKVESVVDGAAIDRNHGCYAIGERHFSERVSGFLQAGKANADVNQLGYYFGGGLTIKSLWFESDAAGISFASAHNGSAYRNENPDVLGAETIYETTYAYPIGETLTLQSSLFYLQHPSMSPDLDNAVAISLRAIFTIF